MQTDFVPGLSSMRVPRGPDLANSNNGMAVGGTAIHRLETLGFLAWMPHRESLPRLKNRAVNSMELPSRGMNYHS
jgi:hypothetical protein